MGGSGMKQVVREERRFLSQAEGREGSTREFPRGGWGQPLQHLTCRPWWEVAPEGNWGEGQTRG